MRPDKSGNLEIFFVTNSARQILKKPFFFHHIPRTSGTSLRFATRRWLWRQECGELIAPGFRQEGLDRDRWRRSVADFYRAVASVARVEAVMGHETAMLAAVVSDPIVAIVREPGAQLASSLAFRPERWTRRGDAVLEALDINNVQTRSLSVADIPLYAPQGRQEYDHWLGLIDQLVNRFRLFRMTDRQSFIEYCKAEYGPSTGRSAEKKKADIRPRRGRKG